MWMHNMPLTLLMSGDHPSSSSLPLPFCTLFPGALHSSYSHCSPGEKEKGHGEMSGGGGCLYMARASFLPHWSLGTSGDTREVSYSFAWVNGGGQKVWLLCCPGLMAGRGCVLRPFTPSIAIWNKEGAWASSMVRMRWGCPQKEAECLCYQRKCLWEAGMKIKAQY